MRCRTQAVKSLAESIFMKIFLNMIIQSLLAVLLGTVKTVSCVGLKKRAIVDLLPSYPETKQFAFSAPQKKPDPAEGKGQQFYIIFFYLFQQSRFDMIAF